jgi:subtilisin family serine protease
VVILGYSRPDGPTCCEENSIILSIPILKRVMVVFAMIPALGAGASAAVPATVPAIAKLERELVERLRQRAEAPLRVVYALDTSSALLGPGRDPEAVQAAMAPLRAAAVAKLRRSGQTIVYVSDYAGLIVASGSGTAILDAAAAREVEKVYLARFSQPRSFVSAAVIQAPILHARGLTGRGARVGVVDLGRIGRHPNLPPGRRLPCRPEAESASFDHKTEAAGIIQSTSPGNRGIAPGAMIIDATAADYSDAEVMAATDCAIRQRAVAINMSFGADTDGRFTALALYVDRVVYNTGVTVVVAVSNDCATRMGSPEIAFNDISVGAFSDRGTLRLGDDRQACDPVIVPNFSAFRNPPSKNSDREQPDLVAPGHLIATTVAGGGFVPLSGTSFAAPHVTAGVALLQDRAGFPLTHQAERVRAILMASARHNIEGPGRLSDRDGAGAVSLAAADTVLRSGQSWQVVKPGGKAGFPYAQTFTATEGQAVRVALTWAHKPGFPNNTVSTDLNLRILDPSGAMVAASASRDNNFEIVAFTAPATATYRIRVDNRRPSTGAEHLGLAVSRTGT